MDRAAASQAVGRSDARAARCEYDMCLYRKPDGKDLIIVGVYVGNHLATGTSVAAVQRFFDSLASLSIKDLGRASKFLGMRVELDKEGGYTGSREGDRRPAARQ